MSRKQAREIALHLIFEMSFQNFQADEALFDRLDESIMKSISGEVALYAGRLSKSQIAYISEVVKGVAARREELDGVIETYSRGWKLSRLSRITIAVLRLALYEMSYVSDVPIGAAINEAVELTKQYDTNEAASFVNGILGSAARAENDDTPVEPIADDKVFADEPEEQPATAQGSVDEAEESVTSTDE